MNRRTFACLLIALVSACGNPATEVPAEPPLHLYLLAGQSNMAGRGEVGDVDRETHPRVFALKPDHSWGPASDPLHWDKPNLVGVGPGLQFAKEMAQRNPGVRIGVIPTAVGGSSIRVWVPGAVHPQTGTRPWDDAVSRTFRVLALEGGELKGVIWHQGESDRRDFSEQYGVALVDLVDRMRAEFRSPNLPFVAAQLSSFLDEPIPGSEAMNEAITSLPARLPHTAFVSGDGFKHKGDDVHLDAASERELGRRFAEAMSELIQP